MLTLNLKRVEIMGYIYKTAVSGLACVYMQVLKAMIVTSCINADTKTVLHTGSNVQKQVAVMVRHTVTC